MEFDTAVPERLKQKQLWFASIIARPIDDHSKINPESPSGKPMKEEACDHIAPSPTLQPIERIQIYNQQFWWRLLNTLHEEFPLVTRLFGYKDFNDTIGIPYIEKYLPDHWSLSFLGNRLSRWVEEDYKGSDKKLVLDAVRVDWHYNYSFIAAHYPPLYADEQLNSDGLEACMREVVYLQPHMSLYSLDYDIFHLREEFLECDPDYWLEHNFPEVRKDRSYYYVFYRNLKNCLTYEEISEGECKLLQKFEAGNKIEDAIKWLENQNDELKAQASENLHIWVQKWIVNQWLTPESKVHNPD